MRALWRARQFLAPYWLMIAGAVGSLILGNVVNFAYPQLLRRIVDVGIARQNWRAIVVSSVGLVLLAVVRAGFGVLQAYWAEKSTQNAAFDVRNQLYRKLQMLGFSYHDQAQTAQLLTRVTSDVDIVRLFVSQGSLQFVGAAISVVGSAAILLIMNLPLGLIAVAILPAVGIVLVRFSGTVQPRFAAIQARLGALNAILEENLAGARVVKGYAREDYERARYRRANEELLAESVGVVRVMSKNGPLTVFLANLGLAIVILVGGLEVMGQQLTLGKLVAFVSYLNLMVGPISIVGQVVAGFARAAASAERIFDVFDAPVDVQDSPTAGDMPPLEGAIEFRDVSFRYVGTSHPALFGASFRIAPGQIVAIVGATGSGKSTIANLIPRFYDPVDGEVLVDGINVRDVKVASLRRRIGVVLQDTQLFSGTIRENVAFGRPDASFEEIVAVARAAQAHDFILEQPQGYETRLGDNGAGLSGGQRQRIAIARALLLDPRILILDDSTSSVDVVTEHKLRQAIERLIVGRTAVIIAHRISSVRRADLILVVDRARIVARGTHEELLETCPLYAEIVAGQLVSDPAPALVGSRP